MSIVNGLNADLSEWGPLYARSTNWWNMDISDWAVDPTNTALQAAAIAATGNPPPKDTLNEWTGRAHADFDFEGKWGMPIAVVDPSTPRVHVEIENADESDLGPYPIPAAAITNPLYIENGYSPANRALGDEHMLMIDRVQRIAYELSYVSRSNGQWYAGYGAIFDLKNNVRRTEGFTSTDAAGLCVAAGLYRYDEVFGPNEIEHAVRFALKQNNGYVWPASHDNNVDYPGSPPLGSRIRLKASFDTVNKVGGGTYVAPMQKALRGLKKYGGLLSDRGGGFRFMGTMDTRWSAWPTMRDDFHTLHLSDFEFTVLGDKPPTGSRRTKYQPSE